MSARTMCCGASSAAVRFIPETETSARLEIGGTGFEVEAGGTPISPYHLLAASLSSCTTLTLQSWAEGAGIDMAPVTIHVSWERADEPRARIRRIEMEIRWPGLPADRIATVERVAELCPIHATLSRAAHMSSKVLALPAEPS